MKNLTLFSLVLGLWATTAQAIEPMNCAATPTDIHCKNISGNDSYGTVGSGPVLAGSEQVRGGYVTPDGKTLILAIEMLSDSDHFGAVVSVDLQTGNRAVISGNLNALNKRGKGVISDTSRGEKVELYNLNNVYDVAPLPNGDYAASTAGQVIRINKDTGDRTLLWTTAISGDNIVRDTVEAKYGNPGRSAQGGSAPATGNSGPNLPTISTPVGNVNLGGLLGGLLGGAKPAPAPTPAPAATGAVAPTYFCPSVEAGKFTEVGRYIETDSAGNIYLLGRNVPLASGFGLFKLDANDDYRCKVVSQFDVDGTNKVGSGIPWTENMASGGPEFWDFAKVGTRLYASGGPNPSYLIISVDSVSGERTLVAGQTGGGYNPIWRKGTGNGLIGRSVVASGGNLYTTEEQSTAINFGVVRVDPNTGNRTNIYPVKGSTLESAGRSSNIRLYAIPGSDNLLVWFSGVLHIFNPNTGMSSIVSR